MQMQPQMMNLQLRVFQRIMKGLAGMRCGCGTPTDTHTGLYCQRPESALGTAN